MIEMLGVLAIVGMLSIGGIVWYSKAMSKYKLNQTLEQYNFIFNLIESDMDKWKRIKTDNSFFVLTSLWKQMGIIPEEMIKRKTDNRLYDKFGNSFYVRKYNPHISITLFMNNDPNARNVCIALYNNLLLPRHNELKFVYVVLNNKTQLHHFYGDKICAYEQRCLRDMTMTDIVEACQTCSDSTDCALVITWIA